MVNRKFRKTQNLYKKAPNLALNCLCWTLVYSFDKSDCKLSLNYIHLAKLVRAELFW